MSRTRPTSVGSTSISCDRLMAPNAIQVTSDPEMPIDAPMGPRNQVSTAVTSRPMGWTITRMRKSHTMSGHIGVSHSGVHLKRKHGGPPWWKHMNGFWLQGKKYLIWFEFFKSFRTGPLYQDRAKYRTGKSW